jgi:hypothetical protein
MTDSQPPQTEPYVIARVPPRSLVRRSWGPDREARSEAILEAIRRWADLYGAPPTMADWEPSRARRLGQDWRAGRWQSGDWPTARLVRTHFGTLSAAVRAAGMPARRAPTRSRRHLVSSETVLDAIRAWHARYGEPPAMTDWDPSRARTQNQHWRIARYYEGDWPSINTVRRHFGTLNQAVQAAGLPPRTPGQHAPAESRPRSRSEPATRPRAQNVLALRVRSVAQLARRDQPHLLIQALTDLAAAASSWADEVRAQAPALDELHAGDHTTSNRRVRAMVPDGRS